MSALFTSGRIIDAILALTIAEGALVVWYRMRTGHGPPVVEFLFNLASGMCLLAAMRVALVAGWWCWIALCLVASLAAHLANLRLRWQQR